MLQERFPSYVTYQKRKQLILAAKSHRLTAVTQYRQKCSRGAAVTVCCASSSSNSSSSSSCSTPSNNTAAATSSSSSSSNTPGLNSDNPLALAFLGDAIWTLYVRRHFFYPPKHYSLYHAAVRPYITAEGQAGVYDSLLLRKQLTPKEVAFLRRVRAWEDVKLRKRFSTPAAADTYRKATALEALVGHLHLHDPQRLEALVAAALPPPGSPMQPQRQDSTTS